MGNIEMDPLCGVTANSFLKYCCNSPIKPDSETVKLSFLRHQFSFFR